MSNSSKQDPLPYRLEAVQVILSVKDIEISRKFYRDILQFKEVEWANDHFTAFERDGFRIFLCKGLQGNPGMWVWMGFHGDIKAMYKQLKDKEVNIKMPPTNFSWAMEMQVEDPDGHVLRFGTDPDNQEPYEDSKMKLRL